MEDGVKEEPARTKEPTFLGKAGWVKKSTSRFLGGYKDRYIQVEKTEVVVYENEDLQTCLERVDLENYDKCLELRSAFLKKNRLVLIQTPKSANKVHDVKFQAQNPEEREAWIKALQDGINRAKNKVFDEVKTDEGSNLDHVTRTRPKGNRNRRPPTRIHMKDVRSVRMRIVANVSSEGILRLDLDVTDSSMPNGSHYVNIDPNETPKEALKLPMSPSKPSESIKEGPTSDSTDEGPQIDDKPSPKKKILKPPMPPIKEIKPTALPEEEPLKDASPAKKVLKPPMPPSNAAKPIAVDEPETSEETSPESDPMESPETGLFLPNKPISSPTDNLTKDPLSTPHLKPPTPPSKDKKPTQPAMEHNHEATPSDTQLREENKSTVTQRDNNPNPLTSPQTTTVSVPDPEEEVKLNVESKSDLPVDVVSTNDLVADNLSTGFMEKKEREEEKSVDSGQHSEDDGEVSEAGDMLMASTSALHGSHAGLDLLDVSEEDAESPDSPGRVIEEKPPHPTMSQANLQNQSHIQVSSCQLHSAVFQVNLKQATRPPIPVKPSVKARCASVGDLLSEPSGCDKMRQPPVDNVCDEDVFNISRDGVIMLQSQVSLELEKTGELLGTMAQSKGVGSRRNQSEELLVKAMEKLKIADQFLRKATSVKGSKLPENSSRRNSF
ncbi:uncharacterized protein plekho2 [Aplochiton taeniatus]